MTSLVETLRNHPRRMAFIAFNVAMVLVTAQFGALAASGMAAGVGGFAEIAIGYTGMALAIAALAIGWALWTGFIAYRHRNGVLRPRHAPALVRIDGRRHRG